jgi:hypothetical protein
MQYYLITNIDTVTVTGGTPDVYGSTDMHLHASAIVLMREDRPVRHQAPCRIRLFGPDSAWPITELAATSLDHEISPIPFPVPGVDVVQISYALVVAGWKLKLVTESQDGKPPDVTAYPDGTPIGDVWNDLGQKVAEHWRAPHMPLLTWVPVSDAKQYLKRKR